MTSCASKPTDLVGSPTVCAALGIDRSTLIRRIDKGKAPQPVGKLEGPTGSYIFRRADVEAAAKAAGR